MNRQQNYWEGHPRAQAATDSMIGAGLGMLAGGIVGLVVGTGVVRAAEGPGGTAVGVLTAGVGPWIGGMIGAWAGGRRKRTGFSEQQSKRSGTGAAIGSALGGLPGGGVGSFFATERASNPELKRLSNSLCR